MKIIAITGSIGTGKSFVANCFVKLGAVLFDADKNVHEILSNKGEAFEVICKEFPDCYVDDAIDRKILSEIVFKDNSKRQILEDVIYPFLDKRREDFLTECRQNNVKIVVMEIPLLFEKNKQDICDYVVVTKVKDDIQKQRVLSRKGMSLQRFQEINNLQMSTKDKISRADFVIDTSIDEILLYKEIESIIVRVL